MIYNDGNSELHIRLHIAEMLKEKVEQENFEVLCNKVLRFVMNGIDLPKVKKNPMKEAAKMLTKTLEKMIKEIEGEGKEYPKSKADGLE